MLTSREPWVIEMRVNVVFSVIIFFAGSYLVRREGSNPGPNSENSLLIPGALSLTAITTIGQYR